MRKSFALNREPHEAEIGDTILQFVPEALGDEFLDGYMRLRDVQRAVGGDDDADPGDVRKVTGALREFLGELMLPESRTVFAGMQLPNRVLVQLVEWAAELYGGGSGSGGDARPTGPSSGSRPSRRTPGTPSKAS